MYIFTYMCTYICTYICMYINEMFNEPSCAFILNVIETFMSSKCLHWKEIKMYECKLSKNCCLFQVMSNIDFYCRVNQPIMRNCSRKS